MTHTISLGTETAVAADVTKPLYLIEIGFSTTVRFCTRGSVTWNGYAWAGSGVEVESLAYTTLGGANGSLVFQNTENAMSALILGEGVKDRMCRIWEAWADALDTEDPSMVFSGVCDSAELVGTQAYITVVSSSEWLAVTPRIFYGPPLCNHMPPKGTKIVWNGETYILEPR